MIFREIRPLGQNFRSMDREAEPRTNIQTVDYKYRINLLNHSFEYSKNFTFSGITIPQESKRTKARKRRKRKAAKMAKMNEAKEKEKTPNEENVNEKEEEKGEEEIKEEEKDNEEAQPEANG